jgi:hypothetical protein
MRLALILSSLLGCVAACARGNGNAPASVVTDSAGITIVTSRQPAWPPGQAWTVASAPDLEIGVEDGDSPYLLSRVAGAIRLDDGRIVVADGGSNQLRFYDSAGRFLTAVGRSGRGPGEFEYIRALGRCGADSIYAFDLHWGLKAYDRSGSLAREVALHEPGTQRTPYALSCSRTGRFLITGWGEQTLEPRIGLYRAFAPVWLLDGAGEPLAQLGEFPSSERLGTERSSRPHPFGRATVLALDAEHVFLGTGDTFEIRVYDMAGALVRLLRVHSEDLAVGPDDLARYRADRLDGVAPDQRPALERELRDMPMPSGFPAYDRLMLDPGGNLWVRKFRRPGWSTVSWAVLGPDGALRGDVTTPPGLEVTEIGGDYVLGIHQDDLGVQRVRLHRLTGTGPRT